MSKRPTNSRWREVRIAHDLVNERKYELVSKLGYLVNSTEVVDHEQRLTGVAKHTGYTFIKRDRIR